MRATIAVLLSLVMGFAAGCIGLRPPTGPGGNPLPVPEMEGTVTTQFVDMITQDPVAYKITFPNPDGAFTGEAFRLVSEDPPVVAAPTLHFKLDEPLDVYVPRFFNQQVPPFTPVEGTGTSRASSEEYDFYASEITVDGTNGWLVVSFRADGRVRLGRYERWFAAMLDGAQVALAE